MVATRSVWLLWVVATTRSDVVSAGSETVPGRTDTPRTSPAASFALSLRSIAHSPLARSFAHCVRSVPRATRPDTDRSAVARGVARLYPRDQRARESAGEVFVSSAGRGASRWPCGRLTGRPQTKRTNGSKRLRRFGVRGVRCARRLHSCCPILPFETTTPPFPTPDRYPNSRTVCTTRTRIAHHPSHARGSRSGPGYDPPTTSR